MADNTTRNEISREVSEFYDRTLLERAVPLFIHQKWAQVRDIPQQSGTNTIKFRRYGSLAAATTALQEGVTPQGKQMSVTDITATVKQYGDYVTLTDVVQYESPDANLMETAEVLGEQAGETLDILTRDVLTAGTNVVYVNQTQRSDITTSDTIDNNNGNDIHAAVRILKNNNARRVTRMVEPSTGYNTTPINAAYIGIVHPDTTYDMMKEGSGMTGFTPVEKYASQMTTMEGEVGKFGDVRFVESTQAKVFENAGNSNTNVYATVIMGRDAYGVTRISGQAMQNIVKPLGSGGSSDPLNQRMTSGWKATFTCKILNNDFVVRVEHASSTS
jgi:N4-gp56 family major capsid protein